MVFCTFYHIGCCQLPFVRELFESSLDFLEVLRFAFSVPYLARALAISLACVASVSVLFGESKTGQQRPHEKWRE